MLIACALVGPMPLAPSDGTFVSSRIEDRVVKRFDFDERKLGNYELTPMNWRQIVKPGYPRFLEPRIDADVGHDAPPSFKLGLCGGSLACRYLAKDIPVHPDSDYRITVWIRASRVTYAGAYVSACFLDHALQRIDESCVRSVAVRGPREDEAWHEVSVLLRGGHEKARWIGLSCHLEQPASGSAGTDELRPIERRDPNGVAWFDDITVLRLPRVSMRMEAAGGVFAADEQAACVVRVADVDGRGLSASLDVLDDDRRIIASQDVPIVAQDGEMCAAELGRLSPGRYVARLIVSASGGPIASHERPFVQLGPDLAKRRGRRGGFGLLIDPAKSVDLRAIDRLVGLLSPDFVKVPLWRSDLGDDSAAASGKPISEWVRSFAMRGTAIVGVLASPPASLTEQIGQRRLTIMDVLTSRSDFWHPYLEFLFARYGERVHAWQIGADDATGLGDPERIGQALDRVRDDMRPLVGSLQLAVPQDAVVRTLSGRIDTEIESVYVGAHIHADRIDEQLGATPAGVRRWATLEPLDPARYSRQSRFRELARRIVMALQAGAETVFIPQPWSIEGEGADAEMSPSEDFMVFRTLRQSLAGLTPMGRVWLDHGVSAWLFGDPETDDGAMVVWTDGDEESPRVLVTDIAPSAKAVDLWGNPSEGRAAKDELEFALGSLPIVLAPVAPSRVRTMASFAVNPTDVTPTIEEQRATVSLRNGGAKRMVGRLRLMAPPSWRVTPSTLAVDVPPGSEWKAPLTLRLPSNQAAGPYVLVGRFSGADQESTDLTIRAPIFVRSADLDVNVLTRMEGRGLRIMQRVTNLSGRTLDLQSLLIAPNRPRQIRTIQHLVAGQSVVREYQIEDGADLSDRCIRVSVEQIDGPLRHHDVIKIK